MCVDPKCSTASRRRWGRRYGTLAGRRLVEVGAEGRQLVEATLKLPGGVGLVEVSRCIRRFKAAVSAANRRRAGLGYLAILHPAGRNGGGPHLHLLAHSTRPASEVEATIRGAWVEATGENLPLHCERIRDPIAIAKYATGDTVEGRADPQVLARYGPPAMVSNRLFFGTGGARAAWRAVCAERHGKPVVEVVEPTAVEPVAEVEPITVATVATVMSRPARGSDSSGAKSNDLPGGPFLQTTDSERTQGVRSETADSLRFGSSITTLE